MIENRLKDWAASRGYLVAIAGPGVIATVRRKLEERRAGGLIDPGLFSEYLSGFRYLDDSAIAGPKRVVMVAAPSPIQVLTVIKGGKRLDALIPPTYVRYNQTFADVLADMKENALGPGVEAETLRVPLKSLAIHMGLVAYGRNNITYAPGLGTAFQLCGYVVGMMGGPEAGGDGAAGFERTLERCAKCRACIKACPTGAIREDRFLISAERCFVRFSESPKSFPPRTRAPKSLCLIGCMDCQTVCPENKGFLKTEPSGVEFTAEETEAVVAAGRRLGHDAEAGGPETAAAKAAFESARAKFARLGMTEDLLVMGRNLGFFFSNGVGPQELK